MNVNAPLAAARSGMSSSEKRMVAILAVILITVLAFGTQTGRLFFVDGLSSPSLVGTFYIGKYKEKAEFTSDGMALITSQTGETARFGWSRIDGNRIELTRGDSKAVCNYRFLSYSKLTISDCDLAADLTREQSVGFW